MSDFNRVILMGYIGNEPEVKTSAQGKPYLKLSVATHAFKGKDEKATYWHRVMVFGAQAEICGRYLRKGSQVLVEGSLECRTYSADDGKKVTSVSVIADDVRFMGGRVLAAVKEVDEETPAMAVSA